jgi:hypothetical protein
LDETDIPLHMLDDVDVVEDAVVFLYLPEVEAIVEDCIQNSFLSPIDDYVNMFIKIMQERLPHNHGTHHTLFCYIPAPTLCRNILQF